MCGIVGYIGNKNAARILLNGLHRLEYRGYDSAGMALVNDGNLNVYKCAGRVADLEKYIEGKDTSATIGVAHTRWATHGEPIECNAQINIICRMIQVFKSVGMNFFDSKI